jgi:hypothetical protein
MGQFRALVYKNWILYKRGIIGNIIEILIPILFVAFTIAVRKLATVTTYEEQSFIANSNYTYNIFGNPSISLAASLPIYLK